VFLAAGEFNQDNFDQVPAPSACTRGISLEGCYQDWCIIERERYHRIYLMMLARLVQACEAQGDCENGLSYGAEILRSDRAYERAHRQMMRLYLLSGDRSQALRQYERCAAALKEELGVAPSKRTTALYEKIRADSFVPAGPGQAAGTNHDQEALKDLLDYLKTYAGILDDMQTAVHREILEMEHQLSSR
jgi:DNA-binding SARP family transcriptional activator